MMKKILSLTLLMLLLMSSAALAKPTVGVLLIGDSSYKTTNFYDYVIQYMGQDDAYNLVVNDDLQGKWQEYWLNQGELDEQKPKKQDLLAFVKYCGYDKVLYLMCKDPVTDTVDVGLLDKVIRHRTSVTVGAFLCNSTDVIKVSNVAREDDSTMSELRARRGAFKKAVREISKTMNPLFAE